ncbi:MAG: glycoside hydrolase family 97 protein [Calditrichia bacterium]
MGRLIFVVMVLLYLVNVIEAKPVEVNSPSKILTVQFDVTSEGVPTYRVYRFGREIISTSSMGFTLKSDIHLDQGFEIEKVKRDSLDEVWTQVWGEQKHIRNHYHELTVHLKGVEKKSGELIIQFRAYDDGIGFRYIIPKQTGLKKIEIMDEKTQFAFPEDHQAWWIPAYEGNRYEFLYKKNNISQLDVVHTPVTFESNDGLCMSIHEAALTDFSSMTLRRTDKQVLEADLVPWWDGVKVRGELPVTSPWRTIQVADDAGGLITSYLILNLNEPNKLKDTSWIEPGKYVGIWWEMHLGTSSWGSGPIHGATTENTKKYIDFAAKYGFKGVLVEGWNVGWDGNWADGGEDFNFTKAYPDFDIDYLTEYAKSKGVYLVGHHETGAGVLNYEKQLEEAMKFYEERGVKAVKTGYVGHGKAIKWIDEKGEEHREWHHGQFMVRHYRKVVEEAAKHHIMIIAHEPIKPTGIRRTYPNMMSREGARGQEYNAWAGDGGNPPEHTTILPFTRLLAGPMDFTPGIFDLTFEKARPNNRVNTTLAKQLALYVVIYSPFQMAADLPENYEKRPDAFKFIVDVPTDWDETRVLHAKIGDYVTIVRKKAGSDEWYLGSVTDENGRMLYTDLSFLPEGKKYRAEIYRDGDTADWDSDPYQIVIETKEVVCKTVLPVRLAPGGGMAVRFVPLD